MNTFLDLVYSLIVTPRAALYDITRGERRKAAHIVRAVEPDTLAADAGAESVLGGTQRSAGLFCFKVLPHRCVHGAKNMGNRERLLPSDTPGAVTIGCIVQRVRFALSLRLLSSALVCCPVNSCKK